MRLQLPVRCAEILLWSVEHVYYLSHNGSHIKQALYSSSDNSLISGFETNLDFVFDFGQYQVCQLCLGLVQVHHVGTV